jgi:hypothetical protein
MTNTEASATADSWRLVKRSAEICAREADIIANRLGAATETAAGAVVVPIGTNAHVDKIRACVSLLIDLTTEAM